MKVNKNSEQSTPAYLRQAQPASPTQAQTAGVQSLVPIKSTKKLKY